MKDTIEFYFVKKNVDIEKTNALIHILNKQSVEKMRIVVQ
jgi:hypothetical protein